MHGWVWIMLLDPTFGHGYETTKNIVLVLVNICLLQRSWQACRHPSDVHFFVNNIPHIIISMIAPFRSRLAGWLNDDLALSSH